MSKDKHAVGFTDIDAFVQGGLAALRPERDPGELQSYIDSHSFDLRKTPDENSAILFYHDIKIGSRGNILAITGKAKSRKTVVASAIATSAFLNGESFLGFRCELGSGERILHIDTEQGYEDYYNSVKRILDNANLKSLPSQFKSVQTRDADIEFCLDLLEYLLKAFSPTIVILDGVTDLVYDINSQDEATRVGRKLLAWSSIHNALIIAIIHTTQGGNKMTGAIGTYLEKKGQTVIHVEKDEEQQGISHVKCLYSRNKPFDTFSIEFNEPRNSYVVVNEYRVETKGKGGKKDPSAYADDIHESIIRLVYNYQTSFSFLDLGAKIIYFASQVTKDKINSKSSRQWIEYYSQKAWIFSNPEGQYLRVDRPTQGNLFASSKQDEDSLPEADDLPF